MKTPKEFAEKYVEAFGSNAPLPISFGYSNTPRTELANLPRCLMAVVRKVCEGEALTLSKDNIVCSGASFFTGFSHLREQEPLFFEEAEAEHLKQTKEQLSSYADELNVRLTDQRYLNLVRVDKLKYWDDVEGVICFANPDVLSGLCSWAFYDNNASDAVSAKFASGCCSIITFARIENQRGGRTCFLGMFDVTARSLVPKDELTFAIPMSRLEEMMITMDNSALFQKSFSEIRNRINGENVGVGVSE